MAINTGSRAVGWVVALLGLGGCHQEHNFGDAAVESRPDATDHAPDADDDAGTEGADADAAVDAEVADAQGFTHLLCDIDRDTHHDPACVLGRFEPADDCDDSVATRHPGAPEVCNQIDDDCDGATDGAPLRCTIAVSRRLDDAPTELAELAAGAAGQVYAAGRLFGEVTLGDTIYVADNQLSDGLVVSYAADGDVAWATLIRSPEFDKVLRVASHGDAVFVAGTLGASATIATHAGETALGAGRYLARLDAATGVIVWIVPIDPPAGATELQSLAKISALAVNGAGQAYVAAETAFDPAGGETWLARFDAEGDVVSTRITPWSRTRDIAFNAATGQLLVLGAGVYQPIAGCEGAGTTDAAFLLALDADGACVWMRGSERLPSVVDPPDTTIELTRVAVSAEGQIAFVGTASQSFRFDGIVLDATPTPANHYGDSTAFVVGTTASGAVRYVHRVDTAGPDAAHGLAIDADGDVYAALEVWQGDTDFGTSIESGFESAGLIVALASDGTLRWQRDITDAAFGAQSVVARGHDALTVGEVGFPSYPVRLDDTTTSP